MIVSVVDEMELKVNFKMREWIMMRKVLEYLYASTDLAIVDKIEVLEGTATSTVF